MIIEMIFELFGLDLWLSGLSSTCLPIVYIILIEVRGGLFKFLVFS